MGPTIEIQDDQFQSPGPDAEMPDEEGQAALAAELLLAEAALARLGDDRALLEEWWDNPKRRTAPTGPLQQFLKRARRLRANDAQPESYEQGRLGVLPEN